MTNCSPAAARRSSRTASPGRRCTSAGDLVTSPKRGHFQLTESGCAVVKAPPSRIDLKFLEQYPKFVEFRRPKENGTEPPPDDDETPEEAFEAAHQKMNASLASDVLTRVKSGTPEFFEQLVVELLLKMGYGGSRSDAGKAVGKAGDEGIDGIISEDRLGLDIVYLQAKKWDSTVGRPEIQKFVGALQGKRARRVFSSRPRPSAEARAYVEQIDPKVVLINGKVSQSS